MLKLSLTEFSLPKFYELFGISKVCTLKITCDLFNFMANSVNIEGCLYKSRSEERVNIPHFKIQVKSAAVSAFRTSYRPGDRSFTNSSPEQEKMSLQSLEIITDALLEIKEVDFILWTGFD